SSPACSPPHSPLPQHTRLRLLTQHPPPPTQHPPTLHPSLTPQNQPTPQPHTTSNTASTMTPHTTSRAN
ncbi:hypothetical protein FWK35_00039346, partial [Aphis craccivora]